MVQSCDVLQKFSVRHSSLPPDLLAWFMLLEALSESVFCLTCWGAALRSGCSAHDGEQSE